MNIRNSNEKDRNKSVLHKKNNTDLNKDLNTDSGTDNSRTKAVRILKRIICIALLFSIFFPPFIRGLFFEEDQLPVEIFILVLFTVFWIYKWLKKDKNFLVTPVDYASFLLLVVYFVSIFVSVSTRAAITEWLKYCTYFAIFIMASEMLKSSRMKKAALWVITSAGVLLSLIGIDGMSGSNLANIINSIVNKVFWVFGIPQHDAITSAFDAGRITSSMQYPNALASFLMVSFLIAIALGIVSKKTWQRLVAGIYSFILLLVFVFTLSRGALILAPVAIILFVLVLPKGFRIKAVTLMLAPAIPFIVAAYKFSGYVSNPATITGKIWLVLLIGILISVGVTLLANYLFKYLERIKLKVYLGIVIGIVIGCIAGAIVALNTYTPLILSHSQSDKDSTIASRKSMDLTPGGNYKLVYDVDSYNSGNKPDSYSINVMSRSVKDILSDKEEFVTSVQGKSTNGLEKRELSFKVPQDNKVIYIDFINTYSNTGATFKNAKILNIDTGKVEKDIALKYKFIPDAFVSRVQDIGSVRSNIERGYFYKDALKIFKDHWLIGAGGGAWSQLYTKYQSYNYISDQSHNYFLQVADETGIIGFIILLLLILSIIGLFLKEFAFKTKDLSERIIQASIFAAIIYLLMHSFIDFNFSFGSVFILFWTLLGIFNSRYRYVIKDESTENKRAVLAKFMAFIRRFSIKKELKLTSFIAVPLIIIIVVLTSLLQISTVSDYNYSQDIKEGNLTNAKADISKAVSLDPYNAQYMIKYANLLLGLPERRQEDINKLKSLIEDASKQDKYNSENLKNISKLYFATAQIEKGISSLESAVAFKRFDPQRWEDLSNVYLQLVNLYIKNADIKTSNTYLEKVLSIVDRAEKVNKECLVPFIFTPTGSEYYEKAYFTKNFKTINLPYNYNKVVFYNLPNLDINKNGIPDQWESAANNNAKFEVSNNELIVKNNNPDTPVYIQTRDLNMQPGKAYRIELELDGYNGNSIPFLISNLGNFGGNLEKEKNNIYAVVVAPIIEKTSSANALMLQVKDALKIKGLRIIEQ